MGRTRLSILAKSARPHGECRGPPRCWRSFGLQYNASQKVSDSAPPPMKKKFFRRRSISYRGRGNFATQLSFSHPIVKLAVWLYFIICILVIGTRVFFMTQADHYRDEIAALVSKPRASTSMRANSPQASSASGPSSPSGSSSLQGRAAPSRSRSPKSRQDSPGPRSGISSPASSCCASAVPTCASPVSTKRRSTLRASSSISPREATRKPTTLPATAGSPPGSSRRRSSSSSTAPSPMTTATAPAPPKSASRTRTSSSSRRFSTGEPPSTAPLTSAPRRVRTGRANTSPPWPASTATSSRTRRTR